MTLTKALVQSSFRAARSVFAGAQTQVRIKGKTYTGLRVSLELLDDPEGIGALQEADSAVRLDVSDFKKPYPKAGDNIDVKEADSTDWKARRIGPVRYDQTGGTVILTYGERFG